MDNKKDKAIVFLSMVSLLSLTGNLAIGADDLRLRTVNRIQEAGKLIETIQMEQIENAYREELQQRNLLIKQLLVSGTTDITKKITTKESIRKYAESNIQKLDVDGFLSISDEYDLDPGFVLAMFCLESGYGSSDLWLTSNNPAGIKPFTDEEPAILLGDEVYRTYENEDEGVRAMYHLLDVYVSHGRKTPLEVRKAWSETNDVDTVIEIWNNIKGA